MAKISRITDGLRKIAQISDYKLTVREILFVPSSREDRK